MKSSFSIVYWSPNAKYANEESLKNPYQWIILDEFMDPYEYGPKFPSIELALKNLKEHQNHDS